ncbi:MAG: hypothetical protein OXH22_13390 [Chloroflexi bacterium]|nr:hypothetical protein [Chloroflexota bacterium]
MRNENLTVPESQTSDWKVIEGASSETTHGVWINTTNSSAIGDRVDRMEVVRRFDNGRYVLALFEKPMPGIFMAGPSRTFDLNAALLSDAIAEAVQMGSQ